ncbi:MAG TPA: hypothetical protein VGP68_20045 [Gemmataceae bacterium]|nr:hypothetical protein [Gemmataceae bacterium]
MKYFTPNRLMRLQDHSDKKRYLRALNDWERALQSYRDHLEQNMGRLPRGLRKLVNSISLHDAQVLDMWHANSRLNITLRPESDPSKLVVLRYVLLEQPRINREALPETMRSLQMTWLYDEWDAPRTLDAEGRPVFTHDILLSNGWEIRLRFQSMAVTRPSPLVPTVF